MNGTNNNHDPSSLMDRILFLLRDRQQQQAATTAEVSRKAIQKNLTSSSSDDVVTKKDVKEALKQLVKRGIIMKNGKKYKLQSSSLSSSDDNDNESNNSSDDESRSSSASVLGEEEIEETAPFVPIAQRIRQTTQQVKQSDNTYQNQKQAVDFDEEIRRLEAELAQSSDDNDDEDESDDYDDASDNDGSEDIRNSASSSSTAPQDNGIICLSSVADERIAPLPHGALPQNKRRTLKNIDSVGDSVSGQDATKKKSKKRKKSSQGEEKEEEHTISEGLKDAVNELLQNYVPSSHLKKPFYCRVCQHQSESEEDFLSHKQSEFHRGAVQQERKRTYCKLCRKQLTSIVQMEEHLKSRPHREKMDFVKSKQNGGGGRGGFRNQGGRHGRDASGKQWC